MKVVVTSSDQAEVITAVESVKTVSHFRCLLVESGMTDSEFVNVHEDNQLYGMMVEAIAND